MLPSSSRLPLRHGWFHSFVVATRKFVAILMMACLSACDCHNARFEEGDGFTARQVCEANGARVQMISIFGHEPPAEEEWEALTREAGSVADCPSTSTCRIVQLSDADCCEPTDALLQEKASSMGLHMSVSWVHPDHLCECGYFWQTGPIAPN
jgi:hypothetical protein